MPTMDTITVIAVVLLCALNGVQVYTANVQLFSEETIRNVRSTNDREPEEHHHHRHHHPMICCDSQTETSSEEEESNKRVFMECERERFKDKGPKSFDRNASVCLMNCVMKKLNLMEDNGRMKKKALEMVMDHHHDVINNDAKYKIWEICYEKRAGPIDDKWRNECNKEPYNLVACAHQLKEMFCPEEKQIEGKRCKEYREEVKKMYSV